MECKDKNTHHQTGHDRPEDYERGPIDMVAKGLMAVVLLLIGVGL
jgi:hypothetical protein